MQFHHLQTEQEIKELISWHNEHSVYVVVDTETTSVNPHQAQLVDIQLSGKSVEEAVIFDGKWLSLLKKLKTRLVLHNFKYDYVVCKRHGWDFIDHNIVDTMLLSHLVNENRDSHSLSSWVLELYADDYKEKFWAEVDRYTDASMEQRINYACADIGYTSRLYSHLVKCCNEEDIPTSLIDSVHDFAKVLARTEFEGIAVDLPYLAEKGVQIRSEIEQIKPDMRKSVEFEVEAWEMSSWVKELDKRKTEKGKSNVEKKEFNFDSSKQLLDLFYNRLGLESQRNEKTKQLTVDDSALEKLLQTHPVVPLVQKYRGLNKVYGSFIEGTLERVQNDRIYPSFNVIGTVTGRTSSSNPNLQQLPASGGIRGIYIPDPGYVFISADYSQLEVCLAAHFSQDKQLLKIVMEGASQHDITAESLKISRQQAKTLNFAMQYRCSHFKVAKLLGLTAEDGKLVWEEYWRTYAGLKRLMDECDRHVDRGEPIINPFGRKRRFEVKKRQPWDSAYRQAFNSLIQGTGADLTNRSLTGISNRINQRNLGKGLFVVHDEIIAAVRTGAVEEAREIISEQMCGMGKEWLSIPLKVEVSEGMDRWND